MDEPKKGIDHEYTDEVVCPYCGLEHSCSYEFFSGRSDESETQCECGKYFSMIRNISVDYSSSKMCEKNKEPHDFKDHEYKGKKYQICEKCGLIKEGEEYK
jgi:hypothetical protein